MIVVQAHEMDRALDEADLPAAQRQYFEDWLEAQSAAEGIERSWTSSMVPPALNLEQ